MKVEMSKFLTKQKPLFQDLVKRLSKEFEYVSILGTDSTGMTYQVRKTGTTVAESMMSERGFVVRVYNGKGYSEYSFNESNDLKEVELTIRQTAKYDVESLMKKEIALVDYPILEEGPIVKAFFGEVDILPESVSPKDILKKLANIMNKGLKKESFLIDLKVNYQHLQVCKFFISSKKDLQQSYIWSNASLIPIGRNEQGIKDSYYGFSGLKGAEILDEMDTGLNPVIKEVEELLSAEKLIPGEYDIICDPSMSGLIAHEAFGHGIEMDMFVKKRAKAIEYMNKQVASSKVRMRDGSGSVKQVSSYLFDDEGTLGSDTLIIDNGILKSGISDVLSALKLGSTPTGNGRRESFERKVYTRMTNTFFEPGEDSLDEMIASINKGYLLENFDGGMEDPKNWGIQCVAVKGREIINGKFSGKIVAPVFLTGYVPDLLQSISMTSEKLELDGTVSCGKGYKEFVKVSAGGPYIKTKGRLA